MECIQFNNEGMNLVGMLHLPSGAGPFPTVIYCHGFTGHRYEPGWLYVLMARRLADAGIASFRFDCRFSGESEGDFPDMTISSEISDAMRAVDVIRARTEVDAERLALLGFSLGGAVASEAAARRGDIRSLMLWSPVSDPAVFFADLAERMGDADSLDLGPATLGRGFIKDMERHSPVAATRRWNGPVKVLHGTADAAVPIASGEAYMDGPGRREMVAVDDADHAWYGAGIREILYRETVEWFRDTL